MAQHDYVIDNSTGANVRADINSVLQAISSNNSGSSAPSTTYALQSFANTTDSMLQLRNAANNAFVNLRKFDGTLPLPDGSASSPSLFFDDDTNTGLFSSAADTLNFTTGGVERMELGATTIFNEDGADVDFRIEGDTEANLFYVDAGNERVGVRTNAPSDFFEVTHANNSAGGILITNTNNSQASAIAQLSLQGGDNSFANISLEAGGHNHHIKNDNQGNFIILDGSSERMIIDSSGNVGIGISSPSDHLNVSHSANTAAGITITNTNNSQTSAMAQLLIAGGDNSKGRLKIETNGAFHTIDEDNNGNLIIEDNGTERLRIHSGAQVQINGSSLSSISSFADDLVLGQSGSTAINGMTFCSTNSTSIRFHDTADAGEIEFAHSDNSLTVSMTGLLKIRTNGSERFRVDSDGNLLKNTTSTINPSSNSDTGIQLGANNQATFMATGGPSVLIARNGSAGEAVRFGNQGTSDVGSIDVTTSSTSYNTSSDYRLKENVVAISDGITRLKTLKPYRFNFIIDPDKTVDGFLAHEVTAVPEAITGTKDEVDADNKPVYQGIDQSKLVPLLVAALQELIGKVEALEAA